MSTTTKNKKRFILPDLKNLGGKLAKIDSHFVVLLAKRMEIARQVEECKYQSVKEARDQEIALEIRIAEAKKDGKPISKEEVSKERKEIREIKKKGNLVREQIERDRVNEIAKLANAKGLDDDSARAFLKLLILASCQVQIIQRDDRQEDDESPDTPQEWRDYFMRNLLALTAEIAPVYDAKYGQGAPFSTDSYIEFEDGIFNTEIGALKALGNNDLALDLGCATGRVSFMLAPHFKRVIGFDVSPQMIGKAYSKKILGLPGLEFREADFEKGLPFNNGSVSFVVMNQGTASEAFDFRQMLVEIKRVLKKDGRFLFSFYNSTALIYHWFLPWMPSLASEINLVKHCLDVTVDKKIFQIFARPYSVAEIESILDERGLKVGGSENKPCLYSYPTLAPILPEEFFEADKDDREKGLRFDPKIEKAIKKIDRALCPQRMGAYLVVTGRKP